MSSSTVNTILTSGINAITDYFTALLPQILPVAVGLAVLFGIIWWIHGAASRKY